MSKNSRVNVASILLYIFVLISGSQFLFAQRQPICDTTCGPDPSKTTTTLYDRAIAARGPNLINQRAKTNASIAIRRMPLVNSVLGSQSFTYSINLVSLAGRNNTSVNLSLTYNSRVWTRTPDGVIFNADVDNPIPGFRGVDFGFVQWNVPNSDWILTGANGNKSELVNVSGPVAGLHLHPVQRFNQRVDLSRRNADIL